MENEFLRVTLDPARCGIRSIIDKRTGRELVNAQSPYALGQYLYERFDADQGLRHAHDYVTHRPQPGPGRDRLPEQAQSAVGQGASLSRGDGGGRYRGDLRRRDIRLGRAQVVAARHHSRCHATPRHALRRSALARSGMVDRRRRRPILGPRPVGSVSRSAADDATFRLARLGSIVNPAKDLVRSSNHDLFCLNGGLDRRVRRRAGDRHLSDRRPTGQPGAAGAFGVIPAISWPTSPTSSSICSTTCIRRISRSGSTVRGRRGSDSGRSPSASRCPRR